MKQFTYLCLLLTIIVSNGTQAISLTNNPLFGGKSTFVIELNSNEALLDLLKKELTFQRDTNIKLKQQTLISRIALQERDLLLEKLHSEGYYSGKVKYEIKSKAITYTVLTGPVYKISQIKVQHPEGLGIPSNIISLKKGDNLRAEAILDARNSLTKYVVNHSCLYTINVDYRVVINHKKRQAKVSFTIDDSPSVIFGELTFSGVNSIEESYLRRLLSINSGDCFKRDEIDKSRLVLLKTDLLSSVDMKIKDIQGNTVPIEIKVIERRHRTKSAGLGYEADEGVGISLGWEHRNIMGRGQKFTVDTHFAQRVQRLSFGLTLPHYRKKGQVLGLYSDLEQEDNDTYQSESGSFGIKFSRQLRNKLRGTVGADLAFSRVDESGEVDDFALLSFPVLLEYDRRDQILDPRKGWVLSGQVQPYWNAYNTQETFLKSSFASSIYFSFSSIPMRPVIAFRGAFGTISGENQGEVPANLRWYSGGGGSVRGYPFRTVGTLTEKEPDGGLSFTEVSVEARLRWAQDWGAVVFVDGGYAYLETVPRWGEDLLWGGGIGVRYYTSFAPIRLDVAVPFEKRDGIDDPFQLYISIGQAF